MRIRGDAGERRHPAPPPPCAAPATPDDSVGVDSGAVVSGVPLAGGGVDGVVSGAWLDVGASLDEGAAELLDVGAALELVGAALVLLAGASDSSPASGSYAFSA